MSFYPSVLGLLTTFSGSLLHQNSSKLLDAVQLATSVGVAVLELSQHNVSLGLDR